MKKIQQTMIARSLTLAFAGTAVLTSVSAIAADDIQTVVVTAQSRIQTAGCADYDVGYFYGPNQYLGRK